MDTEKNISSSPAIPANVQHLLNDSLAAYPNAIRGITCFWGHHEFYDYMQKLQMADRERNHDRAHDGESFTLQAFRALLNVERIHDETFPLMARPVRYSSTHLKRR